MTFNPAPTDLAFDLLDPDGLPDCTNWINEIKPGVPFNNAALFDIGTVLEADLSRFHRPFGLNVRAMCAVMQAVSKSMAGEGKGGFVINLASQAGHWGEALVAHYGATKAEVISFTQIAALAMIEHIIRVNAISPRAIDTSIWKKGDGPFAKFKRKEIDQKKREVGKSAPLGYIGKPQVVSQVAVFPASTQSQYITAQTLSVDGGNVLR